MNHEPDYIEIKILECVARLQREKKPTQITKKLISDETGIPFDTLSSKLYRLETSRYLAQNKRIGHGRKDYMLDANAFKYVSLIKKEEPCLQPEK